MWPLQDITIYYQGGELYDAPDSPFGKIIRFIADFYHNKLNGYKPPKTARICIHFAKENPYKEPIYFGAICLYGNRIDEDKYRRLEYKQQLTYILDLLHSTVMELADKKGWDRKVFENAYQNIVSNDFKFLKFYPIKLSRDRRYSAQAFIEKTEDKSFLNLLLTHNQTSRQIQIVEKRNWYWFDSIYALGADCKWIDKHSFGYIDKKANKHVFYSITDDEVISNIVFENNF
ncbi:hypothetical protein Q0590_36745 [Rhodocytophaga aerolata]|uniref:Uncharacterized protein n=1 Tax=Rhodocytophaga aerolata TaxID=455078 RepID=A0ABT8RIE1_9BACT|nr:hypothetical protein [Rhodocytophaga aerolata]MDO1451876.1 hypothetical protein [Rhodocytophaga aerolata]